ncbi:uncharacterized protein LOC116774483 isoform X2 [Danaus plexippus]|uniref:uncharacterized protein LOC116774483 isoform X2 n=1 Tax=Danaus plexippus TaxID=13037 RepID=UPI0013C3EA7D|nr:uncharacterized protein LOC116774483 isoform X2 [Danaus plexippus]XP_032523119.1 uncharacterized protein LOC116774484 isoform X2 [Danaus plexippus plexippus]
MYKIITAVLLLSYTAYARISVMYAHEKISDMVAQQCLTEMYPKGKKIELQESDESCIIYCVLKKFGIINGNGQFNLDIYRKRVQMAHQLDSRNLMNDKGGACVESAEATQHKQDVCKKAKVFNDCTHLYRMIF